MTLRNLARLLGFGLLAFIAFATLAPIGLRPGGGSGSEGGMTAVQYLGAYGVLGALFAIAYPKRWWLVAILVLGSATLLELAQLLTPDRHARIADAAIKVVGGVLGIAIGGLLSRVAVSGRHPGGL